MTAGGGVDASPHATGPSPHPAAGGSIVAISSSRHVPRDGKDGGYRAIDSHLPILRGNLQQCNACDS